MLSVNPTALQDSNIEIVQNIGTILLGASIYGKLDIKYYTIANLGTNRLELQLVTSRTQRELSSSVVRMKGPSQDSLFENKTELKSKKALSENKSKNPTTLKRKKTSKTISQIAFQTDLKSRINQLQKNHQKIYNLNNILCDENFLVGCYLLIKGKPGNMSEGTTPETLDGLDLNWFKNIVEDLKRGSFDFKPSRQVQIPKVNKQGEFRTLSVGSPRDKIVQKALQVILEAIWEDIFSDTSHGFRPRRSVHTALLPLYLKGRNYTWVIQGDISKCFDTIPHEIIMKRIEKKIGDPAILELLKKYLKAGSKTKTGKIISSNIGTPQGGILSPILANIVLNELDYYVESLKIKFEKGINRKHNPEYQKLKHEMSKLPLSERLPLNLKLRTLPYGLSLDPNFKRMMYVRYADDFVILIEGSHNEAVYYRNLIKSYLNQNCGLTLNLDKTIITNLSDNKFKFLGAEIIKLKKNPSFVHKIRDSLGRKSKRRGHIRLLVKAPLEEILLSIKKSGFIRQDRLGKYHPVAYTKLTNLSHYEIIVFYNSKINGLFSFYSFASNFNRLRYILYLLQMSCAYTLARKYKLNHFAKSFSKFGKRLKDPETDVQLNWPETMKVRHDYKQENNLPKFTDTVGVSWSGKLTQSTFGKNCVLCGTNSNIEMHHLRTVKNVRARMRTGNSTYQKWIGATQRKQIPLCSYHHHLYHDGMLSASDLREISKNTDSNINK
jgi:group II intron reverse transcriptase/maturase